MTSLRIHFLQHASFEGPGYIMDWASANGYGISHTRFYEPGYDIPKVEDIDLLIILGGPMSVYDEHQYSWLHKEKVFIEDCILAGKKLLGICLGAQLIAHCLGARVSTAKHKEIGWFPVRVTEECEKAIWFYDLFSDNPVVFHWHGDKFEIPSNGSLDLLVSEANANQAFLHEERVLGLQFHLEIGKDSILGMIENCSADLDTSKFVQDKRQIIDGLTQVPNANRIMVQILEHLIA